MKIFNDKTGTVLHYRHLSLGNRVVALWLCGSLNSISIRFVSQATEQGYNTTYYIMRGIMEWIRGLPKKPLKGTTETDGACVKAGSKGVTLDINGEGWTTPPPSCRGPPHGPGHGTTPKGQAETTIHFQRAMGKPDVTIMDAPRDDKTLADMVQERTGPGSTVMTDEHAGYRSLKKQGYDHRTTCHGEGEYESGKRNYIHANNCE